MPKSMTGIFRDLAANRREARQAQMQFVVQSLTKKGVPAKVTRETFQWNARRTREEAAARKVDLEQMNPGKTFVILAL
jgi:hypothetical protein